MNKQKNLDRELAWILLSEFQAFSDQQEEITLQVKRNRNEIYHL